MFNRIFKHKFISVDVNINIQKTNEIRKLMKKKFRLSINHSVYLEEFKQGNKTHIDDLFFLIQNKKNNISNKNPPSRNDHNKFCRDHPYRFWFLIYEDKKLYGSIYITNENSIGINFLDMKGKWNKEIIQHIIQNITPMPAKPSLVQKSFYCNVPPDDKEFIELLEQIGAKVSQISYKFK